VTISSKHCYNFMGACKGHGLDRGHLWMPMPQAGDNHYLCLHIPIACYAVEITNEDIGTLRSVGCCMVKSVLGV
jgi:hypothetical protein